MRASVILCYFVYAPARVRYLVLFCNGVNQGQLSCVILYLLTLGSVILHTRHSCLVYLVSDHTRVSYLVFMLTPGLVILCCICSHQGQLSCVVSAHTRVSYFVLSCNFHSRVTYLVLYLLIPGLVILCCICSYRGQLSCTCSHQSQLSCTCSYQGQLSCAVSAHTRASYLVLYLFTLGPVILCCICSHHGQLSCTCSNQG